MSVEQEPQRQRRIVWDDPAPIAAAARTMSGLKLFQAMVEGRVALPAIMHLVGMTFATVEEGHIAMDLTPGEHHYNPLGSVHGGIIATALDGVMGASVHSTLPVGRAYTTLEIKVNYVRAVTVSSGVLRADARVIHPGRQVATAEAKLEDSAGRLYAHGTTTCLVFDLR